MLGARTRIYSQIADSEAVKTTYFTFDGLYRNFLATQLGGDGNADSNRTVFDLRNRPAVSIDQLGYATSDRYDNLDRVVATILPDSVSSEQMTMKYSYDAVSFAGDLPHYPFSRPGENPYLWTTSTIDENGHKQNEYKDARGQTRALRQYIGTMPYCTSYATTYFGYDNLGNLTDVQRPNGDQVHYQYNSLGWRMKEWAADHDTVTYTRDRKGRVTGVKDGELRLLDGDTLSHWKYIVYDPLDRIMETGVLVTRGSDTVSQTPISQFFYDQDNARNSEGRLSVSLSNDCTGSAGIGILLSIR
jgi:YD repeat-containing protein